MTKRKRASAAEEPPPRPASVTLHFANLPSESRHKLDEALRGWADWHAAKYPAAYVPPETSSGSLAYAPDHMHLGQAGLHVSEDRPAAPDKTGAETMWFNIAYEKVGDVPRYDRCTNDQLQFSYSASKRGPATLLVAEEAAQGAAGRPVKRLRLGSNRCFNCGSYAHAMRECWREVDRQAVEEGRREHAESGGAAYRSAAKRYWLQGAAEGGRKAVAAEQTPGEFEGLQPGQLSAELREALGIGPLAPPPWLHAMRALGLPPGYMESVPATAGDDQSAAPAALTNGGSSSAPGGSGRAAAAAQGDEGPLADFIFLGGTDSEEQEDSAAPAELRCSVEFPGVNAPLPVGADGAAWAAQQQQQQQQRPPPRGQPAAAATPPGFSTPRSSSFGGTPGSADRWQQHGPSPAHRSASGGRWQPLHGLHPPAAASRPAAAFEGSLPPASLPPAPTTLHQHEHQQPAAAPPRLRHSFGGGSAPELYQPPPPLPPEPPPPLPLGYGAPPAQQQQQQQQQQWGQPPPPPPLQWGQLAQLAPFLPADGVYSVSRSDPGHMLVHNQQQLQPHATLGQQPGPAQQPGWGQQPAWPAPQYSPQQQYGSQYGAHQEAPLLQHQHQQPAVHEQAQQQAQQQGVQGGGGTGAAAWQQRLWHGSGR